MKDVKIALCSKCGKAFHKTGSQKYCSAACKEAARKEALRKKAEQSSTDPFRPTTEATKLLVERYVTKDKYNVLQIARELKRDVTIIEQILDKLEKEGRI